MADTFAFSPEEATQRLEDESARLRECSTEPIRAIGRIQSYGFLVAIDEPSGTVVAASANAEHLLGRRLHEENDRLGWALSHGSALDPIRADVDGQTVDIVVHRGTAPLLVEFEPVVPEPVNLRSGVVSAIRRISEARDLAELYATAAQEVKALTGFDRVMLYEFHDDGHGQVVADEREPEMEPYFGLHFPASDIPAQARALYIEKRSRVIADTEDEGFAVLTLLPEDEPIDLGMAELRAVSPHHLSFMRNMGQASTFSLSVVDDGQLIGMITSAHRTTRRLPVFLRRSLEVFAAQVSTQIGALRRVQNLQRRLDAQERRSAVLGSLFERADPGDAITTGRHTVLDIVPSDGAVLRIGGIIHTAGVTPPPDAVLAIVDGWSRGRHVIEDLPLRDPAAAATIPGVAGVLVVPLGDGEDRLVYLRSEVAQTVEWLGDQRSENREGRLSPRRSFGAWQESVSGRSLAWGWYAQDAFELGDSLGAALEARAQAQLADLALRDPLTGLYNRRYLDDLLEGVSHAESVDMAVIFLDVDEFKLINDTHGHRTGDVVLRVLARRLQAAVRSADSVVRFGGDEFIVACPSTTTEQALEVADRALKAVAQPIYVDGIRVVVAASAGVVSGGKDVMTSADAAMYRAKKSGGGRVSS